MNLNSVVFHFQAEDDSDVSDEEVMVKKRKRPTQRVIDSDTESSHGKCSQGQYSSHHIFGSLFFSCNVNPGHPLH